LQEYENILRAGHTVIRGPKNKPVAVQKRPSPKVEDNSEDDEEPLQHGKASKKKKVAASDYLNYLLKLPGFDVSTIINASA